MILDRLSDASRREIDSLSTEERLELAKHLAEGSTLSFDAVTVGFLSGLAERPILSTSANLAELVRDGRP